VLTGRPGSERILLELADANMFVVPLDAGRTWFRYHHLFCDLLRLELRRTLAAEVPALHRRAAGWFLRQGLVVDAVRHTQAAGEWADAARLLADHAFGLTLDGSGEIGNARAVICLAEDDPAGALGALEPVLDGTAPVIGYVTLVEAHLLAGLAHRGLGDQRAANQATERALTLAESDRLVLPFAMTFAGELLEALPRHQTAHAALLTDILDVLRGSSAATGSVPPLLDAEQLSAGEARVLRYLSTNLSRPEIAGELSVSVNTISTHIRSIYAKLGVKDRSSAVQRARGLRLLTVSLRSRGEMSEESSDA